MDNLYPLLRFVDIALYGTLIIVTAYILHWLMGSELRIRITHYRYRMRLKRRKIEVSTRNSNFKFVNHLYKLFVIQKRSADLSTVYAFLFVQGFIGTAVFTVVTFRLKDSVIGLVLAVLAVAIPYLYIFVKARATQNEIGSGVQSIVETLIHSYSSVRGDMYAALSLTHNQLEKDELRLVVGRLISNLQTAHDKEDLKKAIDLFIFSTGSSWGMRLGNIILKAYINQDNVSTALLALQRQMITHKKMLEEEKADATDVSLQSGLAVFLFPLSLVGAYYITQPQSWVNLQFSEPIAFVSFTVTFMFVLIAALIGYVVSKPRHDL